LTLGKWVGSLLGDQAATGTISPDGRCVALADGNTARIWQVSTGTLVAGPPLVHPSPIILATFDHRASRLVTVTANHSASLWDAKNGQLIAPLVGHAGNIRRVRFNPVLRLVVTCGEDNRARVWRTDTGEQVTPPLRYNGSVTDAAFDESGKLL